MSCGRILHTFLKRRKFLFVLVFFSNISWIIYCYTFLSRRVIYGSTSQVDYNFTRGTVTWINPTGDFLERLHVYNEAIGKLRQQLTQQPEKAWRQLSKDIVVLSASEQEVIHQVANTTLFTIALKRYTANDGSYSCLQDKQNILVQKYYRATSMPPYCDQLNIKYGTLRQKLTMHACSEDIAKAVTPTCLKPIDFYAESQLHELAKPKSKLPKNFFDNYPEYVFFVNIAEDAFIHRHGYVYTGSFKIAHLSCKYNTSPHRPSAHLNAPIYPEVFVITQFWIYAYYHQQAESLPRISPYLEFLTNNKDIKVHVGTTGNHTATENILRMMGIEPNRLVTGAVRGHIVYVPQSTNCGYVNQNLAQMASHNYRNYADKSLSPMKINSLVMIHRTQRRLFLDYEEKRDAVRDLSQKFNLEFEELIDDPSPPIEDQIRLFRRAAVIIGSHGAGLVNMLYSEPGTIVIEAAGTLPRLVVCFVRLAHVLGHHYHAIPSMGASRDSVNISTPTFVSEIERYLSVYNKTIRRT